MERIPYVAILVAALLIYVPRLVVAREMKRQGSYNHHEPRLQQATLEGIGRRAVAAHQNGFEAFAPFAAAVLAAAQRGVAVNTVAIISIVCCVVRTVYVFAYLGDKASLRSMMWTIGILSSAALMVLAIARPGA